MGEIFLFGALGGLLPDALRLLTWARTPTLQRAPSPLTDTSIWLALGIQIALGLLAVRVFGAETELQALAIGYAAPSFLSKTLASLAEAQTIQRSSGQTVDAPLRRVIGWWRR